MKRLEDLNDIAWLREELSPLPEGKEPEFRVEHRLPRRFERALKILHPMYVDPDVEDRRLTWSQSGQATGRRGERRWWRELAEEHGLDFCPELSEWSFLPRFSGGWPRHLVGPDEGTLPADQCLRLAAHLLRSDSTSNVYFYYDLAATTDWEAEQLWLGPLAELNTLLGSDEVWCSPSIWLPADRSWCVATDYDLTFTLVGGSEGLVTAIEEDEELETLPVDFDTRIDARADIVNRERPPGGGSDLVSFG